MAPPPSRPPRGPQRADRRFNRPDGQRRRRDGGDDDDTVRIWGAHAAEAAIANPNRTIRAAWTTENAYYRVQAGLAARDITPERSTPRDIDRLIGAEAVHQGVLLLADPLPEPELSDLLAPGPAVAADPAVGAREHPLLVVLDQVTDPHNVGAILRSCAAFGASGLIMTRHNSPALGGTLAKSASGALDIVPVALVTNLARALGELADMGVMCLGLDGEGDRVLEDQRATGPTALVLGSEGKGLRRLTRERCDLLCRISTQGTLASLNVSNAAAVALHWMAHRQG